MSSLTQALADYLAVRRAMGFKLTRAGRLLPQFIGFVESQGSEFITTELALRWATQPQQSHASYWGQRLSVVRGFARYCSTQDARTEVPPAQLLPYRAPRRTPYLYSDAEIEQLLQAASKLPSSTRLRAHSYTVLLGLLAVTGMRISEVLALDNTDVDLINGAITIRGSKFHRSRWLAVHPSTQQVLRDYAQRRDQCYPHPTTPSFLLGEGGARLHQDTVRWTFVRLSRQIGLRGHTDSYGPRLHDFRHRFAVQTLLEWYQQGIDVEQHLPELSTYLGHVKVSDTYWYLTATPQLLSLAMQRLEDAKERSPS